MLNVNVPENHPAALKLARVAGAVKEADSRIAEARAEEGRLAARLQALEPDSKDFSLAVTAHTVAKARLEALERKRAPLEAESQAAAEGVMLARREATRAEIEKRKARILELDRAATELAKRFLENASATLGDLQREIETASGLAAALAREEGRALFGMYREVPESCRWADCRPNALGFGVLVGDASGHGVRVTKERP